MRPNVLFRIVDLLARADRPARGAFRAVIEPRKPRHRVLRVVLTLFGLVLLAAFAAVALAVGTVVILGSVAWRLLRPRGVARRDDRVIDATYRVVPRPLLSR